MWRRPLGCNSCSAPAGYACEASLLSEISEEWLQKLILVTRPRKWRLFNRKSLPVMMWCATILAWTLSADSANTPGIPYVQIEVKVPGYSVPWIFRLKLLALDITVQLYFWSWPPDGRGSGRPYSLIEGALSPEPFKPHTVKVALEGISESPLFEQFLSRCEPIASAVICSHVLPRFSGFQNRVILEEGKIEKDAEQRKKRRDKTWQQHARRAGWQPRAEAAVESVGTSAIRKISSFRFHYRVFQTHWWTKAVGQMFQEAGGFAYEAVANTAASAAAQAAGAARLFKNSFGLDIWSFRISWKPLEIVGKFKYEICSFLRLGSANKLKMTPGERWWFMMIPRIPISVRIPWGQCGQPNKFNFVAFQMSQELARSYGRSHDLCREKLFDY